MTDVFVHLSGQDDNLGDSILRKALLGALRTPGIRAHVRLSMQTSDYVAGLGLDDADALYSDRSHWLAAARGATRPVFVLNAGEINLTRGTTYPNALTVSEARNVVGRRGILIGAGMGVRSPDEALGAKFDPLIRNATVLSWRDHASRDAAGTGIVRPDWAFALGSDTAHWRERSARPWLAVTLRFDRPEPDGQWLRAVRSLASRTGTSVVTVAQVARDAPRAVRLAEALDGRYLMAESTRHDIVERHVRSTYAKSVAVVSDRAHALVVGATEGAYPVGSAADAGKIARILGAAGLGTWTGTHEGLSGRVDNLPSTESGLAPAVDESRAQLAELTGRIQAAIAPGE